MRRRSRKNPTSVGLQIFVAVASAAGAAIATAIVTNYFTKKSTIEKVASGDTPLPAGSTPTVEEAPKPEPAPAPAPVQQKALELMPLVAQAINVLPKYSKPGWWPANEPYPPAPNSKYYCGPGYHPHPSVPGACEED